MKNTMKMTYRMCIALVLTCASVVLGASDVKIEVQDLEIEDNVYTPFYEVRTEQENQQGAAQKWIRFTVRFTTSGGWIDELDVKQLAISRGLDEEKVAILSDEVAYVNLKPGDHHIQVYLHPSYVERFEIDSSDLDSAVEFRIDGNLVAEAETSGHAKKGWSKYADKFARTGYLLNDAETPFWYVNYDFKEIIKHK